MQYLLVFLEGIGTFVSPCMLPMLPVYVAYFSGGSDDRKALRNALGFVLGFSLVFMTMGAAAGGIGQALARHRVLLTRVSGGLMILLGISYAGLLPSPLARIFKGAKMDAKRLQNLDFASSLLFGLLFSVGWTPCIGVFLSSALLMAANTGNTAAGVAMLFCYSLGLGIPFVMAALLLDKLKGAFTALKAHLKTINLIAGLFLTAVGVAMAGGWLDAILASLL